jgi:excisionase family DNA binding protein
MKSDEVDPLMTPVEVAKLFRVDPKTITRWAKKGKLSTVRTLGGHRRFFRVEVNQLFQATIAVRSCPDLP